MGMCGRAVSVMGTEGMGGELPKAIPRVEPWPSKIPPNLMTLQFTTVSLVRSVYLLYL